MDTITLQFRSRTGVPLYEQLYEYIKGEIRIGAFAANEKLPSKRKLSSYLKISQNTIESAYAQLMAEGYITSRPKSGFYVCPLDYAVEAPIGTGPCPVAPQDSHETYQFDFKTNTVDMDIFPFATWTRIAKNVMSASNRELLEPPHPQGDFPFRESIAHYLHSFRGVSCSPEQVIVGAGCEYLLSVLMRILKNDTIYAVENPGYARPYHILTANGKPPKLIPLDRSGVSINHLQSSKADVVYVTPSHQFPLGFVMPIRRRTQLIAWAASEPDRYIIEDDYDSEFRFSGRPIPALSGLDPHQKVIYIGTFSKSIAPSIRVAYMVLPPELIARYQKISAHFSSTVSRFEQHILDQFIRGGHFERHLNRSRNVYRSRKEALVNAIKSLPCADSLEIIGHSAGLHLLLCVKNGMNEDELIRRAEKYDVKVYGLSEHYLSPTPDMPQNTVVLGFSKFKEDQIIEAVSRMQKAWFEI